MKIWKICVILVIWRKLPYRLIPLLHIKKHIMYNIIEYCNAKIATLLKRIDKSRLNVTEFENNKKIKLLNTTIYSSRDR